MWSQNLYRVNRCRPPEFIWLSNQLRKDAWRVSQKRFRIQPSSCIQVYITRFNAKHQMQWCTGVWSSGDMVSKVKIMPFCLENQRMSIYLTDSSIKFVAEGFIVVPLFRSQAHPLSLVERYFSVLHNFAPPTLFESFRNDPLLFQHDYALVPEAKSINAQVRVWCGRT